MSAPAASDCRPALVLALDASGSVDLAEGRLQREGLARALLAPAVQRGFLAGRPVALYIFEGPDPGWQRALLPGWQMIESEDDLLRIAAEIAAPIRWTAERPFSATAPGAALDHAAAAAFEAVPDCEARTVDISGDGESNAGIAPRAAYADPAFDGATVNALVIGGADIELGGLPVAGLPTTEELCAWFEAEVLHGPGAFSILARDYHDFARAMEAKLLRGVAPPVLNGALGRGTHMSQTPGAKVARPSGYGRASRSTAQRKFLMNPLIEAYEAAGIYPALARTWGLALCSGSHVLTL